MSVSNGQRANQATFNAGFMSKTSNDTSAGYIGTAKHFVDGVDDDQTAHAGGGADRLRSRSSHW